MKKIKKVIILVSAFAMPNIASPATCNCYDTFNAGWQAANSSFATCAGNYLYSPVGAYAGYYSGNQGGFFSAISALIGFNNCQNTYNTIWKQLETQFDYCVTHYCN